MRYETARYGLFRVLARLRRQPLASGSTSSAHARERPGAEARIGVVTEHASLVLRGSYPVPVPLAS